MKKITELLKTPKFYGNLIIILSLIISYGVIFFELYTSDKLPSNRIIHLFIIISIITIIFTIGILLYINKNKNIEIHKLFFIVAFLYGLIYMVFIPVMLGTDELPHFLRPYQIANGDLIIDHPENSDTTIPTDLMEFISLPSTRDRYTKKYLFEKVDYSKTTNIWYGNVTSMTASPITYMPQIIGFKIAKLLDLSPFFTLLIVRFLNLIIWIFIMTVVIKIIPFFKNSLFVLFTAPATLSLVSTCNYDAFSSAFILLFIAYILKLKEDGKLITTKQKIALVIISLLFCTFKYIYIILEFLILLIPAKQYKCKKDKIIHISCMLLINIIVNFLWIKISYPLTIPTNSEYVKDTIVFILKNPLKYAFIFATTFIKNTYYYLSNIIAGNEMCYGTVRINELFIVSYLALFLYIIKKENEKQQFELEKIEKCFIALIIFIIFGLVSTSLYVGWTSSILGVGASEIVGIQSRYFFVLVPLILILFLNKKNKKSNRTNIQIERSILNYVVILNMILIIDVMKSLIITVI